MPIARKKVIITCALTGSGHTPSMSPYLPYTVEDIVQQGAAAAEAGAAVLHLHARSPKDGSPSSDPALFAEYAAGIRERSDVIISISTGGGTGMSVEERLAGVVELKPELCTLNLGTMNYGSFPMIDRYRGKFKFDWEEAYLESTRAEPFVSTYSDIEYMLQELGPATGTRFEAEAYDIGHIYTLAYYLDKGLVKPPILIQTIFGTMGGIGPDVDHIVHMKRTADRLLGDAYEWSTLGAGRYQMGIVTAAAIMGSHVRVGLEDSLYLGKGQLAESNADQVSKIRGILEALSLEIATPAEARQILELKGLANVGY
jgi:3,5-dioxohexanoate:acetyl-CoA acetone transferase